MGTNSKASHHAYITEPTAPGGTPETPEVAAEEPQLPASYLQALYLAYGDGDGDGYIDPQTDPVGWYQAFAPAAAAALEDATEWDAVGQDGDTPLTPMVKALTSKALGQLTPEQLAQIAEAEGFEHPALVGLSGSATSPLVHWLDPAYPPDIPSKNHIQDVANARYQELAAGGTVGGMTLADLHALEGHPSTADAAPSGFDLAAAQSTLNDAVTAYEQIKTPATAHYVMTTDSESAKAAALLAMIDAENALAHGSDPDTAAAAAHQVNKAIEGTVVAGLGFGSKPYAQAFVQTLAEHPEAIDGAGLLGWQGQVQLLRHSTSPETRAKLEAMASQRIETAKKLGADQAAFAALYDPQSATFHLPSDPHQLAGAVAQLGQAASDYHHTASKSKVLNPIFGTDPAAVEKIAPGALTPMPSAVELSTNFRAYAKTQPISALRTAAEAAGLEHAKSATRAQLQNYLAASWDSAIDKDKIASAVAFKAKLASTPMPSATPGGSALPGTSTAAPPIPSSATSAPGPAHTLTSSTIKAAAAPASPFGKSKANLVAALAQVGAAHADVPTRLPKDDFAQLAFGPGSAANLGGSHTKALHTGSDGATWLVKPDTTPGKWRASAEAGGSAGFAAGGLLAIPVYAGHVDGQLSSVQPLLKGATPFPSSPSSWSQADVDHVVRTAVGAWMVGDHDGKPDNLLRTANGGLLPCDYGAAFKSYGSDKLSLNYEPLTTTAFQSAVTAHKHGGLGTGVAVNPLAAHAAIKAYEKIPDTQWRTLLHETAHQGAAGSAPWVGAMRERAASTHALPATEVTTSQIAEAFLDHAVERKGQLRATFADFFTDNGLAAGSLLKNFKG